MKKFYVAYGSNMSLEQMAWRCPTARCLGASVLGGFDLTFRGAPGYAVATIERSKKGATPVLVWELRPTDEAALDRYEEYPRLYRKEWVKIQYPGMARIVSAMVYIMNPGRALNMPGAEYFSTIRKSYEDAGIGLKPLFAGLARSMPATKARKHKEA